MIEYYTINWQNGSKIEEDIFGLSHVSRRRYPVIREKRFRDILSLKRFFLLSLKIRYVSVMHQKTEQRTILYHLM